MSARTHNGGALSLMVTIAAAVTARLPAALSERIGTDESFFALGGHLWLAGRWPYAGFWDVKPPGLFALYAASETVSGSPLVGLWLLPILSVVAGACGLWWIGHRWFGRPWCGTLAGVLYAFASLMFEGTFGWADLFAGPFAIWGLALVMTLRPAAVLLGGGLIGTGVTILQPCAFEALLAIAIVILSPDGGRRGRWIRLAALAAGGLAPALAFALAFEAAGHLDALWSGAVVAALRRTSGDGLSFVDGLARVLPLMKPALPLVAGALAMLAHRDWIVDPAQRRAGRVLVGWAVAALAGIVATRAMYDHYFLRLLPPLALGTALLITLAAERIAIMRRRLVATSVIAFLCAWPVAWTALDSSPHFGRVDPDLAVLARAKRAAAAPADASLFVFDYSPSIYLLAGAEPPSRLVHPQHLLCAFPLPAGVTADAEIARIFAGRPRFVVARSGTAAMQCTNRDRLLAVRSRLADGYRPIESFGPDPADKVTLYERR